MKQLKAEEMEYKKLLVLLNGYCIFGKHNPGSQWVEQEQESSLAILYHLANKVTVKALVRRHPQDMKASTVLQSACSPNNNYYVPK